MRIAYVVYTRCIPVTCKSIMWSKSYAQLAKICLLFIHMRESLMQFIAEKYLYTKTKLIHLLPINYIFFPYNPNITVWMYTRDISCIILLMTIFMTKSWMVPAATVSFVVIFHATTSRHPFHFVVEFFRQFSSRHGSAGACHDVGRFFRQGNFCHGQVRHFMAPHLRMQDQWFASFSVHC